MSRDEFTRSIRDALGKRVSLRCSNPECRADSTGAHSNPASYIDVGVASHITAASPGGPRYDPALSAKDRASIDNAIWLCQRCAKMIDDDPTRYTIGELRRWKIAAEAESLRSRPGAPPREFFPQPPSATHAPIPRIAGCKYGEARELLIHAGWQPSRHHWAYGHDRPDLKRGNGKIFWERGYWEIIYASGTGLSHCCFGFHDLYGNRLRILTAGELPEETTANHDVPVWSWHFAQSDDS